MSKIGPFKVLLIGLLLVISAGQAMAQSPVPNLDTPAPAMTISPPALNRFQIRHDTPAERDRFLKLRAAQEANDKPEQVAPLPAQRITPLLSQPQR